MQRLIINTSAFLLTVSLLVYQPAELKLESTDTVPTEALRFPGREISASMVAEDKDIEILWKEQLRS